MKSAYERAMERMDAASGPARKLTDTQRERISEIDTKYDARVAETTLSFDEKLSSATFETIEAVRQELSADLVRLNEKRESEKQTVWDEADS